MHKTFEKMARLNEYLKQYGMRAFVVASQKKIEFVDLKTGTIVKTMLNSRVKDITSCTVASIVNELKSNGG